ncbi:ankyrin repeat domain-containing protein 61 [Hemicordylus capensis]|uniref:ankyrin repeat domain-containing protein 61 n=1 Tax=Hemicordylus capensis TaxID=884348 RepID=UPI002304AB60|nr:ankyrin repeat domain-containing protein 61 [Hemicordylus capensis]
MGNVTRGFCGKKHPSEPQKESGLHEVDKVFETIMANDLAALQRALHQHLSQPFPTCPYGVHDSGRYMDCMLPSSADFEMSCKAVGFLWNMLSIIAARSDEQHPQLWLGKRGQIISDLCNQCYLSPLHLTVRVGYPQLIPPLVDQGLDINTRTKGGLTALHLASESLHRAAIEMLLHSGANVHLTTPLTQRSALHIAIESSSSKCGISLAAGEECIKLLLLNGANVRMRDWEGREAIHMACQSGREDLISLLLNHGADINALTKQGESPLFLFLESAFCPRKAQLLDKLLSLSYPLKLMASEGRLPNRLISPSEEPLKDKLMALSLEVLPLQEICKFNIRKTYGENMKRWLWGMLPTRLWNSIYLTQEFSYAAKIKNRKAQLGIPATKSSRNWAP